MTMSCCNKMGGCDGARGTFGRSAVGLALGAAGGLALLLLGG